jgi:hypothetical protein
MRKDALWFLVACFSGIVVWLAATPARLGAG